MPRGSISLWWPNGKSCSRGRQVRLQMSDRAVNGNLALHADESVAFEAVGRGGRRGHMFWKRGPRTEKDQTG